MNFDIMAIIQEFAMLPVAAVCLLLGWYLKKHIPEFPNRFIPLALLAVALVGVLWVNGWALTPQNVLSGICSAALAVYLHQTGKHLFTPHGYTDNVEEEFDDTPDAGGDSVD